MTLLYLSIAYLLGIALGQLLWEGNWFGCHFPDWFWWLPLGLLPLLPWLKRFPVFQRPSSTPMRWPVSAGFEVPVVGASPILLLALCLCVFMGILRYGSHPLTPCWTSTDLAYYNLAADRAFDRSAPEATITGYISSYPLVADTEQRIHIVATRLTVAGVEHAVTGELRLNTGIRQRYGYGQAVRVRGRLVTPPDFEDFSYREYLARKNIHSLLYNAQIEVLPAAREGQAIERTLYALRARGEQLLNRLLPEPYAALTNGMLLGIEAGIPDELYDQFNLTGVSHTIVISGSNISILSAVLLALGQKLFGRRRALWPTLLGIACYALLVGGDAAVLRAALMGGLFVTATAIGRRSTALVSLAAACWVMTIVNPLTLWDVGFQLSSAATAGLILFTPGITARFTQLWPRMQGGILTAGEPLPLPQTMQGMIYGLIQDGLLVTLAANITTLPLVIYYFNRLSFISLLTNFAVAPVQPFIMLWGSLGILIGVIGLTWVAWLLLLVPWLSLVWTVAVVQWTAALPGASMEIADYPFRSLLLTYLVIALFYWRSSIRTGLQAGLNRLRVIWQTQLMSWSAAGLLGVGCVLIWAGVLSQPDGRLHVYFLDIGQGDGILIQTPSGRQVLVDGGKSPQQLLSELGAVMPFWDRSIDLLVLTHPDADHMDGQTAIPQRFAVTAAWDTVVGQTNPDGEGWRSAMATAGATVQLEQEGAWLDLGDGVALWVLWPPPGGFAHENLDNENSLVLKLVYGNFSALLTGDAGVATEQALMGQGAALPATVLKLGHHGSKGSSSALFLQAVNPLLAVIQVGANNDYGHPHQEVLDRLSGWPVLRNDQHGRIHLSSDGSQMWLDTEIDDSSTQSRKSIVGQ